MKKEPLQDDRNIVTPRARLCNFHGFPGVDMGTRNGAKTDPKTASKRSENGRGQKSNQDDPEAVLERSWVVSGAMHGEQTEKTWKNILFREQPPFRIEDGSKTVWAPTWVDKGGKRSPKAPPNRPHIDPKAIKKTSKATSILMRIQGVHNMQ